MTPVEQIKSRLSVVDVVSSYLKLVRAGTNFKAVCPFHSEKSPSFFVSPARDVWHCFGCGVGGDQFRFVMQIEGVEFPEALRILAERAGVELRHENPKERDERSRLFGLMEFAAQFYRAGLTRFPAVSAYLTGRGITPESMEKFRIGYAPPEISGWRVFTEYATKKGYTLQELEKTGLTIRKQQTSSTSNSSAQTAHYYDRFRNRIMFPVTDANARVIGFGGRIFSAEGGPASGGEVPAEAPAKYINSPQTVLYDKSRILYGFDKAKMSIRKENRCIVVEGYMDAVMAHQAGTEHVVAVSGTALTRDQLVLLRRLCDGIAFSFDMDEAGELATRRSIDLALEIGFDVKAISLPSGKDPADLVALDPALWREAAGGAVDVISYFLEKAAGRHDGRTLDGKRGIAKSVLPLIARLPREVDKAHWVRQVASRIGVREESVWADMGQETAQQRSNTSTPRFSKPEQRSAPENKERTRTQVLEERMLGLLFTYRHLISQQLSEELFSSDDRRALYRHIPIPTASASSLVPIADERLRTLANRLVFETEVLVAEENALAECESCVAELRKERIKEKLEQLTSDIRKAEETGNIQQVSVLADEFSMLSRELTHLS